MFAVPSATTRNTPDNSLIEILPNDAIRFLYDDGDKRLGWITRIHHTKNFSTVITIQTARGFKNYSLCKMSHIEKVM